MKKKNREIFLKLSKEDKENLTMDWLRDLMIKNRLNFEDVIEIFNACYGNSDMQRWVNLASDETFGICTIARLFGFGYPKSKRIVEDLVKEEVVEQLEKSYKILSKDKFLAYGEKLFKQNGEKE